MKKLSGVTLIETLITLLAISFMIAGPIFFVSRSFSYSKYVQDKIVATSLAQEGLELATSLRNNSTTTFATIVDSQCLSGACSVDWNGSSNTPSISPCDESSLSCRLNLLKSDTDNSETYRMTGAGEGSKFLRALIIQKNSSNNAYTVTSRVWSDEDSTFKVDVKLKKILYAN